MRCPYCKTVEDRVIDSRLTDDTTAIRRRRECAGCGKRFTTFERAESVPLRIRKRSGEPAIFDRSKIESGLRKACVNRPVSSEDIVRIVDEVEEAVRGSDGDATTQEVGLAVLDRLRELDDVAYVRFASVYRDFQELTDFEREVGQLLQKRTPPKATAREGNGAL